MGRIRIEVPCILAVASVVVGGDLPGLRLRTGFWEGDRHEANVGVGGVGGGDGGGGLHGGAGLSRRRYAAGGICGGDAAGGDAAGDFAAGDHAGGEWAGGSGEVVGYVRGFEAECAGGAGLSAPTWTCGWPRRGCARRAGALLTQHRGAVPDGGWHRELHAKPGEPERGRSSGGRIIERERERNRDGDGRGGRFLDAVFILGWEDEPVSGGFDAGWEIDVFGGTLKGDRGGEIRVRGRR